MKKIALMCDSAADVTLEEEKELGIHVIRLPIIVDEVEYEEATSLNHELLSKMLDDKKVAKTSQPSPGQFVTFIDELLKTYDEVFYIPVAHTLSGTYSVAKSLSENEYKNKLTVVRSRFVSRGIINLLLDAKKLFAKGFTTSEVCSKIEAVESEVYIVPYDLHTLKRGGRISPAVATLAGLLKIQVVLKLDNEGVLDKLDKTRTLSKAKELLVASAKTTTPEKYHWAVLHSSDEESGQEVQKMLAEAINQKVELKEILAIVRAHTGNKTVGISRVRKVEE